MLAGRRSAIGLPFLLLLQLLNGKFLVVINWFPRDSCDSGVVFDHTTLLSKPLV